MKTTRWLWIGLVVVFMCVCVALPLLYYAGRPLPTRVREEPYSGVTYYRQFHLSPRPVVAHIVVVDLNNPAIEVFITPPDNEGDLPLNARTTSQFVDEFNVQVAINGDGFTPWDSNAPWDYYPHVGDPVAPNGFAMSRGRGYGSGGQVTLYISADKRVSFDNASGDAYMAISGDRMVVVGKQPAADLPNDTPAPRTGVGVDVANNRLILVVVDGRQPLYSEGMTIKEFAELMIYYGVDEGMKLDGGGSSTLVMRESSGRARVLNSPIDRGIPGLQRAVGNHLGIYVTP